MFLLNLEAIGMNCKNTCEEKKNLKIKLNKLQNEAMKRKQIYIKDGVMKSEKVVLKFYL